jgi:hypothetical protein
MAAEAKRKETSLPQRCRHHCALNEKKSDEYNKKTRVSLLSPPRTSPLCRVPERALDRLNDDKRTQCATYCGNYQMSTDRLWPAVGELRCQTVGCASGRGC